MRRFKTTHLIFYLCKIYTAPANGNSSSSRHFSSYTNFYLQFRYVTNNIKFIFLFGTAFVIKC